jgi:transketolase
MGLDANCHIGGGSGSGAPPMASQNIDLVAIDTIRTLTTDAFQKAQSGPPCLPLGMAPVAYTLWTRFLRFNPDDAVWANRDRFILSAGHGCMLLYALLHLSGTLAVDADGKAGPGAAVSLDDIKSFRESGGLCPGHPEYGLTTAVEITTGPLGQGAANSVGMAIAERWLEGRYNDQGTGLFDYNVYALCSDGDMMEGVASEAASLAGHLKLSSLCRIYDDNTVTIEGHTDLAFSEDVVRRFDAYGWRTISVDDANDCDAFARAIEQFLATTDQPTFIRMKSVCPYGAPDIQGTSKAHSDPLGKEEVRLTKRAIGWPEDTKFLIPERVRARFDATLGERGRRLHFDWKSAFQDYRFRQPALAMVLDSMRSGAVPSRWDAAIPQLPTDAKGLSTREASGKVVNAIAPLDPWLIGGAADLAPSTKTRLEFARPGDFQPGSGGGRNFHFGVREHAMAAIANGLAASKLRPLPPIEQLAALRTSPELTTLRPCDANETAEAWRVIVSNIRRPSCLVLSRQSLPTLDRTKYAPAADVARGAYILADSTPTPPQIILLASGSEVALCVEAYECLTAQGVRTRVVSMPCWDLFEEQGESIAARFCRRWSRRGSRSKRPRRWVGTVMSGRPERSSPCAASAPRRAATRWKSDLASPSRLSSTPLLTNSAARMRKTDMQCRHAPWLRWPCRTAFKA